LEFFCFFFFVQHLPLSFVAFFTNKEISSIGKSFIAGWPVLAIFYEPQCIDYDSIAVIGCSTSEND